MRRYPGGVIEPECLNCGHQPGGKLPAPRIYRGPFTPPDAELYHPAVVSAQLAGRPVAGLSDVGDSENDPKVARFVPSF